MRPLRPVLVIATTILAAGSLAACGASKTTATTGSAPSSSASSQSSTGAGGSTQRQFPGTSGTIADVTGNTLQVQNQTDGQVAVTYSGTTTISAQVAAALSDVKVGSCVTVTPPASSSSSSSSGSSSSGSSSTAVTAGTVRITQPQNGSCTGGAAFAGGGTGAGSRPSGFPSGRPTNLPSGRPTNLPSGAAGARGGFFGGASGTVASVTANGFTVTQTRPDFSDGQASSGASPSMTTSTVTVTVDGSTTYTTTKTADASALVVGKCVTATGQADGTGTIAATRLAVSDPDSSGQCGGFGGFGGGFGGGSGGQGAQGTSGGAA